MHAVERWQDLVHAGHAYDLEVDTSVLTAAQCADVVLARVERGAARNWLLAIGRGLSSAAHAPWIAPRSTGRVAPAVLDS